MLTLSVKTRQEPERLLERAHRHFTENLGMQAVEIVGHMHGQECFLEIRLSSGMLTAEGAAGEGHASRVVLRELFDHVQSAYGLRPVHYLLHLHSQPESAAGHLVVKIAAEGPTEVEFSSDGCDAEVKEFAARIS